MIEVFEESLNSRPLPKQGTVIYTDDSEIRIRVEGNPPQIISYPKDFIAGVKQVEDTEVT